MLTDLLYDDVDRGHLGPAREKLPGQGNMKVNRCCYYLHLCLAILAASTRPAPVCAVASLRTAQARALQCLITALAVRGFAHG